jgi:hypothetical protein
MIKIRSQAICIIGIKFLAWEDDLQKMSEATICLSIYMEINI